MAAVRSPAPNSPPMIRSGTNVLAATIVPAPGSVRDRLWDPGPGPPCGLRHDGLGDDPVLMVLDPGEHGLDQGLRKVVRLQPQVEEGRVLCVVVVVLGLHPRVLQ